MKIVLPILCGVLIAASGCGREAPQAEPAPSVARDLADIRASGRLVAATGYGASSYFIYKGRPMGFEYELLELLADHLELELEISIVKDLDQVFELLERGEVDIIGLGLTVTKERARRVAFTEHHNVIRQVLVQRKPDNWRAMKLHEIDRELITSPIDLIGKRVHVWGGSSYCSRLVHLSDEIGGDIDIVEVPGSLSTEDLIAKVASGEIDYTVADENIAMISQAYFPDLDIRTPVSLPQRIAWAVRRNAPELLAAVNDWMVESKEKAVYRIIYNKYYRNRAAYRERARSPYYSAGGGHISRWDEMIRARADEMDWDWRLIASIIYQESHFDPNERSWAGAVGLMQLMPETASLYGVTRLYDPKQNILAGTRYLQWLEELWQEIPDPEERLKFVLASYNAGPGHVIDARRLAEKYGMDPDTWDGHVARFILKKSSRQYFNDEVVEHGYCRGEEPVEYVDSVLERYDHYRKHFPDSAAVDPDAGSA